MTDAMICRNIGDSSGADSRPPHAGAYREELASRRDGRQREAVKCADCIENESLPHGALKRG